ncbi:MAG: serine/threonine dehydratase [Thermocrispum sp.]
MTDTPTVVDVVAAANRIRPHVRRTPLMHAEVDGRRVVFKLEHLQRTGSFKLRGATNALLSGPRPVRVVTASGGNHGLAVAIAAGAIGVPVTVHMPDFVPEQKASRMSAAGAKLVRHDDMTEVFAAAQADGDLPGHRYLHPYDDRDVIAGQGTVTAEIVADAPEVDSVVVAVGGGGLAGGAAVAASGRQLIAAEPAGCRCFNAALAAGRPVESAVDSIAASGLGATRIGDLPFRLLTDAAAVSALVSEDQIVAARDRLWEEFRLAVEPAAAVSFAALLAGQVPGDLPCLILCGANTVWSPG